MIEAKIIADSITDKDQRITSFVLKFPRIVLAEFNTHRVFSRNSASSRAVPFNKMLKMVEENPFIPIKFMKDHSGMQGNQYFENQEDIEFIKKEWLTARDVAIQQAKVLSEKGLTKQFCNRLLEPFMWHTVIVTSTNYENFFALRANEAAEIHIQELAYKMLEAYNASIPKVKNYGEWHIPFGENIDNVRLWKAINDIHPEISQSDDKREEINEDMFKIKIATARCARVSYINFEGKDDYKADIELYERLSSSGHFSPFEHCAQAYDSTKENKDSGNFTGWIPLRKMLPGENKKDSRVEVKYSNLPF